MVVLIEKVKKVASLSVLTLAFVILAGCDQFPRGESKTLEQVIEIARDRYAQTDKSALKPEVRQSLESAEKALASLLVESSPELVASNSKLVASSLDALVTKAGYTSRPAITELMYQFFAFSERATGSDKVNTAALRLLVSRTFTTLAVELETQAFQI